MRDRGAVGIPRRASPAEVGGTFAAYGAILLGGGAVLFRKTLTRA